MTMNNSDGMDAILKKAKKDLHACQAGIDAARQITRLNWERLAGAKKEQMLKSAEIAQSFLGHSERELRLAAIQAGKSGSRVRRL